MAQTFRLTLVATTALVSVPLAATSAGAQALPTNPTFGAGPAPTITSDGSTMTVGLNQTNTIIDWETFNVGTGNRLDFTYGGSERGAVLNRDQSGNQSTITGAINGPSNLDVYILNSDGVVFGTGANVNVGGLVASTLGMDSDDFMDGGAMKLAGDSSAKVQVLSGAEVRTKSGRVVLASAGGIHINGRDELSRLGVIAAADDVVIVTAQEVTISGIGSPLSLTISRGTTGGDVTLAGSVTGRNIYAAMAAQEGAGASTLRVAGYLAATTASPSDRGIVLSAGVSASGIELAPDTGATGGGVNINSSGTLVTYKTHTSNVADIGVFANSSVQIRQAQSAGNLEIFSPNPINVLNLFDSPSTLSARGNLLIGNSLVLFGETWISNLGNIQIEGSISNGSGNGWIKAQSDSGNIDFQGDVSLARIEAVATTGTVLGKNLTSTGDILLKGKSMQASAVSAGRDLSATATAGNITFSSTTSTRDAMLNASNMIYQGDVTVGGDYAITAQDFSGGFNPNLTGANSKFTITDTGGGLTVGTLSAPGTLTINVTNGGSLSQVGGNLSSANSDVVLSTVGGGLIALDGTINSPGVVRLISSGALTQTATSSIFSSSLFGIAAGNAILTGANQVSTLAGLVSGGRVSFTNDRTLTVTGSVEAAQGRPVVISVGGATSDLIIDAAAGGSVSGDLVNLSAGRDIDAQNVTGGSYVGLVAGRTIDTGIMSVGGDLSLRAEQWSSDAFAQLDVGGNLSITDTGGGFEIGDLSMSGSISIHTLSGLLRLLPGSTGLQSLNGDISLSQASGGAAGINIGNAITANSININTTGVITIGPNIGLSATTDISATGRVQVSGPVTLTAGNDIYVHDTIDRAAGTGALSITAGNMAYFYGDVGATNALTSLTVDGRAELNGVVRTSGDVTFNGDLYSPGDIDIVSAFGTATVAANVDAGGNYRVQGQSVSLGSVDGIIQRAQGEVTVASTAGDITGASGLTIQSNSDGIGEEMLLLDAINADIDLAGVTLLGGTDRQSDIGIGKSVHGVTTDDISARSFRTFDPVTGLSGNLSVSGDLTLGDVTLDTVFNVQTPGNIAAGTLVASAAFIRTGNAATLTMGDVAVGGGFEILATGSAAIGDLSSSYLEVAASGDLEAGNLSVGGRLQIAADGSVTLGRAGGLVNGTSVEIEAGDLTLLSDLVSSGGISLTANTGAITAQSVTAHGGSLEIEGLGLTAGVLYSNREISIAGNGNKTIASLDARKLGSTATGNVLIEGGGNVVVGSIDAEGDVIVGNIDAPNSLTVTGAVIADGSVAMEAGSLDLDSVAAGEDIALLATAGDLSFISLSGDDVSAALSASANGSITGQDVTGRTVVRLNGGAGTTTISGVVTTPLLHYNGSQTNLVGANRIAVLGASTGGLSLNNVVNLSINDLLDAGAADVAITTSGSLTAANGSTINGALISLSSGANLALAAGSALSSATGDVELSTSGTGNILLDGTINALGNLALNSAASIVQAETSSINAASLSGTSGNTANLTGANTIAELAGFTSAQALYFNNNATLTISGLVRGVAGAVIIGTAGGNSDLNIDAAAGGAVSSGRTVSLTAGRNLDAQNVSAASDIDLTAAGTIDTGAVSTGGSLTMTAASWSADAFADLTIGDDLSIYDTAGDFAIGDITVSGDILISAQDGILSLSSGTTGLRSLNGDVTLTQAGPAGGIQIGNGVYGRTISLDGQSVDFVAGAALSAVNDIEVAGQTIVSDTATLTAGRNVNFTNGIDGNAGRGDLSITAASVTLGGAVGASSALRSLVINGTVDLNGAVRTIGDMTFNGNVASSGDVDLLSTSGNVTATGNIAADGYLAIEAGGDVTTGNLSSGGALRVTADGAATLGQASGGQVAATGAITVNAGSLTARGLMRSSGGGISLTSDGLLTADRIDAAGGPLVIAAGGIVAGALSSSSDLSISGDGDKTIASLQALNAGDIRIDGQGDISIGTGGAAISTDGDVIVGDAVALGSLTVNGSINAGGSVGIEADGDVSTGNLSSGGTLRVATNGAARLGQASGGQVSAAGTITIDAGTITARGLLRSTGGGISLTAGGLLTADRVETAGGPLAIAAGGIVAGALSSASDLSISGDGDKTIASLAALNAGDISIDGSGNITIGTGGAAISTDGDVIVGSAVALSSLTVNGTVSAGGSAIMTAGSFDLDTVVADQDIAITTTTGGIRFGSLSAETVALNMPVSANGGIDGQDITADHVVLNAGDGTISVTGVIDTALLQYAGSNAILNGANRIAALGNSSGALSLNNVGNLVVEGVVAGGTGDISVRTSGNFTIASGGQVRGNLVGLSSGGTFVNARGNDAVTALDHWAIYLTNPAGHSYGGLDSNNHAVWNGTMTSRAINSLSGNRYVFAYQPTVTISTTGATKTYGDDLSGALATMYTVGGLQAGVSGAFLADTAESVFSGTPLISSAGAAMKAGVVGGPYGVTASQGSMSPLSGYALAFVNNGLITVTPKTVTATVTANDKTYDGNNLGTGSVTLDGILDDDNVNTAGTTFRFDDKNAGTDKTVTIAGTILTGGDASNYNLVVPVSALADILKKDITAVATAQNKTYDGTAGTTGSFTFNGKVDGDILTATADFAFDNANAANGKTVNITNAVVSGADVGNYNIVIPASTLASILRRTLVVQANNATKYSGKDDPLLGYVVTSGTLVEGDVLTGNVARAPGERIGRYAIGQGSLTASNNYQIVYNPGTFTIRPDPEAQRPDPAQDLATLANALSKRHRIRARGEILDASRAFCPATDEDRETCMTTAENEVWKRPPGAGLAARSSSHRITAGR
ncbi:YDG domain-containing protein [Allosphingosinicella vermicomposti]|uniref:YDG domain-containing protein n=1 Tax=Allosphingosinicella vermicomposti TaxID=614671 RepID=UPI000D0F5C2D|nr:YDG domain-containing protein [Allosphingosinicella vermicomposti]